MNKNSMNLGQYNNWNVIKHVALTGTSEYSMVFWIISMYFTIFQGNLWYFTGFRIFFGISGYFKVLQYISGYLRFSGYFKVIYDILHASE